MNGFTFKPVAWMTTILGILTGLMTLDETVDVLPENVSPWVLAAIGVLTVVLGVIVHGKVTPVAAPKASTGVPLTPVDGSTDPAAATPPRIGD
jgi:hypothetical protein